MHITPQTRFHHAPSTFLVLKTPAVRSDASPHTHRLPLPSVARRSASTKTNQDDDFQARFALALQMMEQDHQPRPDYIPTEPMNTAPVAIPGGPCSMAVTSAQVALVPAVEALARFVGVDPVDADPMQLCLPDAVDVAVAPIVTM